MLRIQPKEETRDGVGLIETRSLESWKPKEEAITIPSVFGDSQDTVPEMFIVSLHGPRTLNVYISRDKYGKGARLTID